MKLGIASFSKPRLPKAPIARSNELKTAFEVRLTNDLRRIDYAALFDANHKFMFGNIDALPAIPVDGKSHFIAGHACSRQRQSDSSRQFSWRASDPTAP